MKWAVYLCEHSFPVKDSDGNYTKEIVWVKSYSFYKHEILDVNDWRIKEVPIKRKKSIFLGMADVTFPIVYPLVLDSGKTIDTCGTLIYNEED